MSELEKIQRDKYQKNRKKWIRIQTIVILAITVALLISSFTFTKLNKDTYVAYAEEGNVIHRAYLSDNSFYEENYLNGSHAYVASLIEKMTADFRYDLQMATDDVSYQYAYRIDAQLEIKDKASDSPVYNPIYNIVPQTNATAKGNKLSIRKLVELDYNEYNRIANEFVTSYNLKNTVNTLIVRMYVDVVGMSESFAADNSGEYTIELHIPLLETTVKPSVSTTVPAGEQRIVAKDTTAKNVLLILSIAFVSLDVIAAGLLAAFILLTRDKHIDYTRKVQRLVSNYKSYIQKILDEYNTTGYQVIRVEAFTELLEIRDTICQPVFMYENEDRTCTRFFVVTALKSIYIFEIKVEEEPVEEKTEKIVPIVETPSEEIEKPEIACVETVALVDIPVGDVQEAPILSEDEVEVIDVAFEGSPEKNYLYNPDGEQVDVGDVVLVPSIDKGQDKEIEREASVIQGNYWIDKKDLQHPLKKIIKVVKRRLEESLKQ